MKSSSSDATISLIGHPFAPIGCGESLRCSYRAFRSVAVRPALVDVFGIHRPDEAARREFEPALTDKFGDINIFHLNADEVDAALAHMGPRGFENGYNILYPYWELGVFPEAWRPQLQRFDEIWAPSEFIADALRASVDRPVHHLPTACEVEMGSLLSRRYFGIPESAYAFLFFFDFRSYATRKNPRAVIAAFRKLLESRPTSNACLVIKVTGSEADPVALARLREDVRPFRHQILLIDATVTDNEMKNLVRCCDCFVSLHRSEGFGRGLAEAMYLGKPVIATGYSGNLDFMDAGSALLVDYTLVPVLDGEYPHHSGQVWADADVDQASAHMRRLLDDPRSGRELGQRASRMIRSRVGYRTVGMSYRRRLEQIRSGASS